MQVQIAHMVMVLFGCYLACPAASAEAQVSQQELAGQLLGEDIAARYRALGALRELGPKNAGAELRSALFEALERETELRREREEILRAEGEIEPHPDPEFAWRLTEVIVALEDTAAIPVLARGIGNGSTAAVWALVGYGERAAPSVIEVARSPSSDSYTASWALIGLRAMVEGQASNPLSAQTLAAMRAVAEQRLQEQQTVGAMPLRPAIDLAVVLGDPHLREMVERLANDPAELRALGVTDPGLIERTQRHAKQRLAGESPKPRRP